MSKQAIRRLAVAVLSTLAGIQLLITPTTPAAAEVPGQSNGGVRIMPLGDSITDGFHHPGGYRVKLWQDLVAAGRTVDFVGTMTNGPSPLGDQDHEGHSGWRIDELHSEIIRWLYATDPRTILLQIGTNDITQNHDVANAPARLSALIDRIMQTKPNAKLFVAKITPLNNGLGQQVTNYNNAIPGIVAGKGPNVHLVDMYSALTTADIEDTVHPTPGGFDKMADVWEAALNSVPASLQPLNEPNPAPIGATISISAVNGLNVTAWQGRDGTPLEANASHVDAWEKFLVVDAGRGFIGLVSVGNGKYVSALGTSDAPLKAAAPHLLGWEMFRWIDLGSGNFALVAATNSNFVSARIGTAYTALQAKAPHIQAWETFHWSAA